MWAFLHLKLNRLIEDLANDAKKAIAEKRESVSMPMTTFSRRNQPRASEEVNEALRSRISKD